jgi:hypothetical protein
VLNVVQLQPIIKINKLSQRKQKKALKISPMNKPKNK